jgi:hypothetical protein
MIIWHCRYKSRPIINPKLMELETAKEILAEIFHTRPSDIEDMIQSRLLEERSCSADQTRLIGEELWSTTFCLGKSWAGA